MTKELQFYFDVGSPASHLAWARLPGLCAEVGAELVLKPMLLGGVFQATGNASPVTVPAKGRWMTRDLQRHAERDGTPFAMNPHFPIHTLFLMRAITGMAMHEPERLASLVTAVFRGLWVDGLDFNDATVTARALQDASFDAARLQAFAADPAVKAQLKATTDEAVARGVFGAPSIFVGDELFFGQDRLDFVRDALARDA